MPNQPQIEKTDSAFFRQEFPQDLTLIVIWLTVNLGVIYLPILNETIIKPLFVIPFILIIPGYCLIAALFPKKDEISLSERIALSIGLSVAVVPLIGFGLNFTPFGIRLDPIVIALTLFTLVMILVAYYRRSLFFPEERFGIPFFETAATLWNSTFPKEGSWVNHLISGVIALAILTAVILTVYIIAVPKEGERFTEFFILGENKTASEYPDLIITGQNYPMFIGVGNHEYRNMMYTIETWTVLTEFDNLTNSTTIRVMDPLDQFPLTLAHNETVILSYTLSPNKTGYNRVEFLLFNETVPGPEITGSDRINRSYQDLHLWVSNKDAEFQNNSIRAISITQQ